MNTCTVIEKSSVKSLALGGFDGLHLGHRALLERLGENGAVLVIENFHMDLTPGCVRSRFTDKPVILLALDRVCNLTPAEFVAYLKSEFVNLRRLVVGYDFRFGRERAAGAAELAQLFDGETIVIPEVCVEGEGVHSTRIRELIRKARIEEATALLGRPHLIEGEVIRGQGLGMRRLYPTLNLEVRRFILPAEGVYATFTEVKGRCYPSVSFLGHRVSTDGSFAIETHILDENADLHGVAEAAIWFKKRLRANHKFDSLDELKTQIEADISEAQKYLAQKEPPCVNLSSN